MKTNPDFITEIAITPVAGFPVLHVRSRWLRIIRVATVARAKTTIRAVTFAQRPSKDIKVQRRRNQAATNPLAEAINSHSTIDADTSQTLAFKQQCLYFLPLPQGQGSLRPTLGAAAL